MTYSLTVDWLNRPPTTNKHRTLHHHQRARVDAEWREAGAMAARIAMVPKLGSVRVTCWGRYPDRRALPDPDGVAPALKAVLDGIVEAGVLVDDRFPFVQAVTYEAPRVVKGEPAGLVVELAEVES